MSADLFGLEAPPARAFRDIRNQRPSVAEEKSALLLSLGDLINKVPAKVRDGSINITREWRAARDSAAKTAKNSRASVNDISMAINNMRRFAQPEPVASPQSSNEASTAK